jgi:hypothetical protein
VHPRPVLAIVGGGVYVSSLLRTLARTPGMPALRVHLVARDHARLKVIAEHAQRCVADGAPGWGVQAFRSTRSAMAGADAVVLLARIGGDRARAHDEAFPLAFGAVGDEGLGLGGLANGWRTLPVLEGIAGKIVQSAPKARILNLMAPLPLTTRLLREKGLDAIGVCELPATVEESLDGEEPVEYLGVNHLGWFWPTSPSSGGVLARAVERGVAHPETVDRFGAVPLPYYYRVVRPDLGRDLGIVAPEGRAAYLSTLSDRIFRSMVRGGPPDIPELSLRPTPWFDRALAPILRSFWLGTEHRGFINGEVPGPRRLAGGGSSGVIQEYRAVFAGRAVAPCLPRRVPYPVSSFLKRMETSMNLCYRACRSREPSDLSSAVASLDGIPRERVDEAVQTIRAGGRLGSTDGQRAHP